MLYRIQKFFKFNERNATFKKEIIGAVSSFLTMCYILAVNAQILIPGFNHDPKFSDQQMLSGGLFLITAISTFAGTFLLGLMTNLPASAASSLGCNTFFSYTLTSSLGLTPSEALFAAFISSILFFIISITNVRQYLFNNIPDTLKYGITGAIGLYLATVGLKFLGLIGQTANTLDPQHVALVQSLSLGYLGNPAIYLGLFIFFFAFILHLLKIPGSLPFAMIIGLIIGLILTAVKVPNMPNWNSLTHYGEYLKSMGGISTILGTPFTNISHGFSKVAFYVGCLMFLLMMFFESSGASSAFISEMERVEPTAIPQDKRKLFSIDSGTSVLGTALGITPCCMAVSTAVGVNQGARTGFSGMLIALCFGLVIPLYPLFYMFFPYHNSMIEVAQKAGLPADQAGTMIFSPITGAALMFAGFSMFSSLRRIDFTHMEESIPVFFLILTMILSGSIPNGIAFGFFSFTLVKLTLRKHKEINYVTYGSTIVLILYFIILILLDLKLIN